MTPELETRLYHEILRDVLWGATRAEIMEKLAGNDVTAERAGELFEKAWRERLAVIRRGTLWKAAKGLAFVLAGLGVFFFHWDGVRAISRGIFVTCFVVWVFGGYWLIDGMVSAIFASSKKGSVASDV